MAPSDSGFLLLDAELKLIASNDPALRILCYPSDPSRIKQPKILLGDRVRTTLLDHGHRDRRVFVREVRSGKRNYICKTFQLSWEGQTSPQPAFAVLLERGTAGSLTSAELSERFALTQRECETVEYLLQGFTSKEIAARMNISPNTVKAFLRLVMVKMKVSTRSGIAGKITGSRPATLPTLRQN
jgi:DNA-binding CsgD family transcriptional regulator